MDCHHYDLGECRSCHWLEHPYPAQLAAKQQRVADLLAETVPAPAWQRPVPSAEEGFRNKAKLVVAGTAAEPTLGILDPAGHGVDLRDCGLHQHEVEQALPVLADFIGRAALTPYDVPRRRGELKHLLVTVSPDGELMVRFVLRSPEAVDRIRKHLPWLRAELPQLAVASVNLQSEHKAVLEGPEERVLTEASTLRMRVNELPLHLRPQSFFQTNTEVAAALYRCARELVDEADPATVWDLYCGVGGFALHVGSGPGGAERDVVGVESSAEAAASGMATAAELGLGHVRFTAGDATTYALAAAPEVVPDLVIVNPPRRGIGPELAGWLERSGVRRLVYSSCHAGSLARDLAAMPGLRVTSARLLDMFPHTEHHEVLVAASRG